MKGWKSAEDQRKGKLFHASQSRRRSGRGEPSPGADVAWGEPSPVAGSDGRHETPTNLPSLMKQLQVRRRPRGR